MYDYLSFVVHHGRARYLRPSLMGMKYAYIPKYQVKPKAPLACWLGGGEIRRQLLHYY